MDSWEPFSDATSHIPLKWNLFFFFFFFNGFFHSFCISSISSLIEFLVMVIVVLEHFEADKETFLKNYCESWGINVRLNFI